MRNEASPLPTASPLHADCTERGINHRDWLVMSVRERLKMKKIDFFEKNDIKNKSFC
jgi:hypothetical protein